MFTPPRFLRHTHAQTLLASTGPRKWLATKRATDATTAAQETIIDCGDGVRLQGFFSAATDKAKPNANKLVILLHGWLGSESSSYVLSATASLYSAGYNVFRLNLRDHGDTHALNPELFHSARLQEVLDAVANIQARYPFEKNYLAGFSLGGNFALRIAAEHKPENTRLDQVVAICPVINPDNAMHTIDNAMWVYPQYFVRKWKRSLYKKLACFPELNFSEQLDSARCLDDMNQFFVPNHTPYAKVEDYFAAYSVGGDRLASLRVPTQIIHSADDPVVSADDLKNAATSKLLSIEISAHGGHCGFLKDYGLNSWVDDRMLELF